LQYDQFDVAITKMGVKYSQTQLETARKRLVEVKKEQAARAKGKGFAKQFEAVDDDELMKQKEELALEVKAKS
jgi:hypothetical protein